MTEDDRQAFTVFVPYNLAGAPQWDFAFETLEMVRESIKRYHGRIEFGGIYELFCEEVRTHAVR